MRQEQRAIETERQLTDTCRVAEPLARRMAQARAGLSLRWLERISSRVTVEEGDVFPTQELLNHVPLLIEAIANYLSDPADEGPNTDRVLGKAAELGQMRFEQGFSPYQILKEFEILGSILLSYLTREADELGMDCPPGELLVCAHRIHHALALVQQATAARYLALLDAFAGEREQRLRGVNELLTGTVRERLDAVAAAARRLEHRAARARGRDDEGEEAVAEIERLEASLEQIRLLSSVRESSRLQRNVPLKAVVAEATRIVREPAAERRVDLRVVEPLPEVEVSASTVELCLIAFLSAAIRHADPEADDSWVEVSGEIDGDAERRRVVVTVRDNGTVLPESERERLMRPFLSDISTITEDNATGAGLVLMREAIEAIGGKAWIEEAEDAPGMIYRFELPSRRWKDE